jgi:hypothetical protein
MTQAGEIAEGRVNLQTAMELTIDNVSELLRVANLTQGKAEGGGFIPLLIAEPGVGKTRVARKAVESIHGQNALFVTLIGATNSGPDWGLYYPNKETSSLDLFTTGRIIGDVPGAEDAEAVYVFFDEADKVSPEVQAVLLSLVEDRVYEGQPVNEKVRFLFASNPEAEYSGGSQMIQALWERLCKFKVSPSLEAWASSVLEECGETEAAMDVVLYNYWKEGRHLVQDEDSYASDPHNSGQSPRSWTKIAQALSTEPDDKFVDAIVAGYVGMGVARAFRGFRQLRKENLQTVSEIIAESSNAEVYANDPSLCFAQITNIIQFIVREGDDLQVEQSDALTRYFDRLNPVQGVLAFRLAQNANSRFCESNEFANFQSKHRGL